MKSGLLYTLISIFFCLLVGGITVLAQDTPNIIIGTLLLSFGAIGLIALLAYERFERIRKHQSDAMEKMAEQINATSRSLTEQVIEVGNTVREYTNQLINISDRIGLPNDARFIPEGFIGLQRQSIMLEQDPLSGPENVRMAVLGHLPSYMRRKDLTDDVGELLYDNWDPPHYIPEYVKLVNQRARAFMRFAESGGYIRDILSKESLKHYVMAGFTFHDRVVDPVIEIEERLTTLEYLLTNTPNYYLSLIDDPDDSLGHHFLLKSNVGLVLDLRTTDIERHFTNSIEGLSTNSIQILKQFERRFTMVWKKTDRNEALKFVQSLLVTPRNGGKKIN